MFRLLGKIIKYCFYTLLFLFVLLSVAPYLFPLKNIEQSGSEKPYPDSRYKRTSSSFIHYRVLKPDTIRHKIILIPGFAGSTFSFRGNLDALVANKTLVVAIDLPPYGYSRKDGGADFTDTTTLGLINSILQETDTEVNSKTKWIVCGHSLGAAYAAKLVSLRSEMFSKQIFIDGFFTDMQETGFNFFLKYPPLLKWADVAMEYYFLKQEKFSEMIESAYLRKPSLAEVEGYMKPFEMRYSASGIFHWAHAGKTLEVDKLILYSKPTLFIWGDPDPWVPFNSKKVDTTAFKKLTFKFIAGGGHNPQETQPEMVNKHLTEFINN